MRAVLIAVALSLAVVKAGAAQSADASAQWNGFHIGANVGYGWAHRNFTNTITGASPTIQRSVSSAGADNGSGVVGGVELGYSRRFMNNWMLGIDTDLDGADINSSKSACFAGFGAAVCGNRDTDLDYFGTVRGRLGYAFNKVLFYGTGGLAWAHGANKIQFTCLGPACPATSGVPPTTPEPTSVGVSPTGWAAGAGVEWAFRPHFTLGVTYLHLQFGDITEDRSKSSSVVPSLFVTSRVSSNMDANLVRVGVDYHF
jgi:outer membrane immunogenic protein